MTPPRILLALKESGLRNLCRARLVEEGFRVAVVSSGLACLEALRSSPPEVLLLEQDLPWGGDGVVARMREDPSLPHVPLTLLLSYPAEVRESTGDVFSPRALAREIRSRASGFCRSATSRQDVEVDEDRPFVRVGATGIGRATATSG
jgi:CheY-like chemotaxis protein